MSDTQRIVVPLTGTNVTPSGESPAQPAEPAQARPASGFAGGTYQPPPATDRYANSLHRVRMPRPEGQFETVTEWREDARGHGRFVTERRPVEVPQQQAQQQPVAPQAPDGLSQQVELLGNVVGLMARHQYGDQVMDDGPRIPNPEAFDLYDPAEAAEYWKQHHAYTEAVKKQAAEQALAPHRENIASVEALRSYNKVADEYADHPRYAEIVAAAQYALREGSAKTIEEAFEDAVNPAKARPGWAGNIHTPKQLKTLGQIMAHKNAVRKAWGG